MSDIIIIPDEPISGPTEVKIGRKNTKRYIAANPFDVALLRGDRVRDGAGGWRTTRQALGFTQTVRIIQAEERGDIVERRNSDGENVRPILNMIAMWDADVKEGDQFDWNGHKCEVVYITDLRYELTCEVALT